jgi:hypothetical protein
LGATVAGIGIGMGGSSKKASRGKAINVPSLYAYFVGEPDVRSGKGNVVERPVTVEPSAAR